MVIAPRPPRLLRNSKTAKRGGRHGLAQSRGDDDVEARERRAVDESFGDRRERSRSRRGSRAKPIEQVKGEILALRVATRQRRHANGCCVRSSLMRAVVDSRSYRSSSDATTVERLRSNQRQRNDQAGDQRDENARAAG